jgi:hypothetical protein
MKLSSALLLITTLLTGFLGGIGFVNYMGFGPALQETPAEELIRYWQIVDSYMSARMPVYGIVMLLSFVSAGICLVRQSSKLPLLFLVLSLAFVLTDVGIAIAYNFPFNKMIQGITSGNIPSDFEECRNRSVIGFKLRSVCMIGSFAMMLISTYFQAARGLLR